MRRVFVLGVGMTPFGKFEERTLEDLGREAVWNAVRDSGLEPRSIRSAYVANALHGLISGKAGQIGQQVLAASAICGITVVNVENACAGGSTAFRGAWLEVASGLCDVSLALGVEKLYHPDRARPVVAMTSNTPYHGTGYQFTAEYAMFLARYMERYGATALDFAKVVEKNSANGALNPYAQHRRPLSAEEVLASRTVAAPLTLYMCCSIGDGAAAALLCSEEVARRHAARPLVEVAACQVCGGRYRRANETDPDLPRVAAQAAYESAGLGPDEIDLAEVHDAMAPAELLVMEYLGLCRPGEAARFLAEGRTKITGDIPVNPSGGLAARGHPVSATGLAQVAEVVWQLRGEAGRRQVREPRTGLIENAGGLTDFNDNAACAVTILRRA
ncbi:MAG: thiolase family protein [Deltaproteobacteria bacterium]|nr:thiolase family protein [Deltaproteobacteria bacterium]